VKHEPYTFRFFDAERYIIFLNIQKQMNVKKCKMFAQNIQNERFPAMIQ